MNPKIYVLFSDGVEEIELTTPVDILRRGGLDVTLIAAKDSPNVGGAHGIKFLADAVLPDITISDFDILILPGGPSSFRLKDDPKVLAAVQSFFQQGKLIAAICAAPLILHSAGILAGKKYCSHPCCYDILTAADRQARVILDKNLITAKGPGVAAEFGLALLEYVLGKKIAESMREELFL